MKKSSSKILLTFDLEEFDIPFEYRQNISIEDQLNVTRQGTARLLALLAKHEITCTFFITAFFAEHNVAMVKQLSNDHEIASHAFHHSSFVDADLLNSRLALEKITEKKVTGFRMPRMKPINETALLEAGYHYDSSINPIWLPFRYNNLNKPRTIYSSNGLVRIPASVTKSLRIPLFWIFFKNAPEKLIHVLSGNTLLKDGYLNLYFHPWEFADLEQFHVPFWMRKPCGKTLIKKMDRYISFLKTKGTFSQVQSFVEQSLANTL